MRDIAQDQENREFQFTVEDFERIRALLYQHAGISLGPQKMEMVYSRLVKRLRITGHNTFAQYISRLQNGDPKEWEAFINALTTNLTSFFREQHHFPILAEHIKKIKPNRPISIWCAASSTGEEPYSLAITMTDLFNSMSPPVTILATDLDTNVLAKARGGLYSTERVSKLPPAIVKRYFTEAGDHMQVRKELQKLIHFRRLNLLDQQWAVRGPFDAIFCRNVMIYFDKETQYQILKKFVPLLQPDGLLFAGHSESLYHAADLFTPLGKTVYALTESR